MNLRLERSGLNGKVTVPPSKSMAHRAVICSYLAKMATGEVSRVENVVLSKDITATKNAMEKLIIPRPEEKKEIFCGESGSTVRFLIPVAAAIGGKYIFTGEGRLGERPLDAYKDIFDKQRIYYEKPVSSWLPFYMEGRLKNGLFQIEGNISSQYISGLLFALPMIDGDSVIEITTDLQSKPYVDMTVNMLGKFGIKVSSDNNDAGNLCYFISGGQTYKNADYKVEGDYSQAAFWMAAKALGSQVTIDGLKADSVQGDREIENIIKEFEKRTGLKENTQEYIIDVSQIPDLVPIITVIAALTPGVTIIKNAARLRIKESDRLYAISQTINKLGGKVKELKDSLIIEGTPGGFKGGTEISAHNDHRIAMSAAIAALKCEYPVILMGAECVSKSYPDFWEIYRGLGGLAYELDMG